MLELLRAKSEALRAMFDMTERILAELAKDASEPEAYDSLLLLLDARQAKMDEIDEIDNELRGCDRSICAANDPEIIKAEEDGIRAALEKIQSLEQNNAARINELKEKLSVGLQEVQSGRKSISAYTPAPIVPNGFEFDTMQ